MPLRFSPTNQAGSIGASQLAAGLITGPKIASGAVLTKVFTGRNGAGAVTVSGLKVGDVVVSLVNLTDAADGASAYESTVTVQGQIQQSSASDLSSKKYLLQVIPRS